MLKHLRSTALEAQNSTLAEATSSKKSNLSQMKIARLLGVWISAGLLSFLLVMLIYTLFFGRNKVIRDYTVYEGHRFVGYPGTSQLSTSEGYGLTTYGEHGLIVQKSPNPDVHRVLFIGDSFVKAKQVSDQHKFTELVEQHWNARHSDRPIQTLNLGLGGQDMRTYLSFGSNMDVQFQPDLVFFWVSQSDFQDIAKNPAKLAQVSQGLTKPLTTPEKSSPVQDLVNALGVRSFFGQLQAQTFAFVNGEAASVAEAAPPETALSPDVSPVGVQLEALQAIWGDRLVIMYRRNVPNMGRDAPSNYEDHILTEIQAHNIPVIDIYPIYWQAFQDQKPPVGFHNSILGEGHLNQYGHQLVADEIIRFLETANDLF
jgi:hypothetical protein